MNITSIPLASIDAKDRVRPVDEAQAAWIAASLAQVGQTTPIEVREAGKKGRYILVAGAHRLRAAEIAGWTEIAATVFAGTADQARLREIDENLARHELNPIDQGAFLAERKRLWLKLHPEALLHGGDRKSKEIKTANVAVLIGAFPADAGEKIGLGERTIERILARHEKLQLLPAHIRLRLPGTPLARVAAQLDAFLRVGDQLLQQRLLAEMSDYTDPAQRAQSFAEALARVSKLRPEAPGAFERFLTVWRRADGDEKARILDHLVAEGQVTWRPPVVADAGSVG